MNTKVGGCRPAAGVLGVRNMSCSECPFPFCVTAEAGIIRMELKEHLVRAMQKLGNTAEEIAKAMGVSTRSTFRYTSAHEDVDCAMCNLIHSESVMCRSDVYTVTHRDGRYLVMLNQHRHATKSELKAIECFIEYVFPISIIERSKNGHDCWVLSRFELEEAEKFEGMCAALEKYTLSLSRGMECLQQIS